ncbi:MAG: M23 family peptidase, partial [Prevotella sp.]|nr:M23 family peptidase [Prevotella sp.]
MKTSKIIIIVTCAFSLDMPIHAQFNTIGTVNNGRINTTNPSKPHVALTDSIVSADSLSHNTMPLVSLPLKNIHINSNFGMRMHPIYHKRIMHNGVDLHARHEDVLSMLPGRVIRVGYDSRSG